MKIIKTVNFIILLSFSLGFFSYACSNTDGSGDAPSASAKQVSMSDSVTNIGLKVQSNGYEFNAANLDSAFNETLECLGFNGISPDIFIILKEPYSSFPCIPIPTGCGGLFDIDNGEPVITVTADFVRLRHEFIHYMLYIQQGDADSTHDNHLLEVCT